MLVPPSCVCGAAVLPRLPGRLVIQFFESRIHLDVVRHWFGAVKKLPAIRQLLHVLSPGAPGGVARGGDLHAEIAYGNHPSVASHEVAIHKKKKEVCYDVVHGRTLVFDLLSAVDIVGLRESPLAVILEPKLRIVHDLSFASAGGRTSVNSCLLYTSPSPRD